MIRLASILHLVLLTSVAAAPVPKQKKQPYFPTTVGTKWVWQEWNKEERYAVLEVEEDGEVKAVTVGQEVEGEMRPVQKWRVSAKEVCQSYDQDKLRHTKVKTPFVAGETWEFNITDGAAKFERTSASEELVKVPAGEFAAIRVDIVRYSNGELFGKYSEWYATGIGLVKRKYDDGEVQVLKSLEKAK